MVLECYNSTLKKEKDTSINTSDIYAHTKGDDSFEKQLLADHLLQSAQKAYDFGKVFDGEDLAFVSGLFHDLGKASEAFQKRLLGDPHSVDHSTAGAQEVYKRFSPWGILLAYIIAGHHGGLMDYKSSSTSSISERLKKNFNIQNDILYQSIIDWITDFDIPKLNPPHFFRRLQKRKFSTQKDINYSLMFLTRMIFSCLVDADFLDTEYFMDVEQSKYRSKIQDLTELHADFMKRMTQFNDDGGRKINKIRTKIFLSSVEAAKKEPGFFSLTVPTGGGKTLSSMGFALEHAKLHNKIRIIYAIPYTSIIEQNADVFRSFLGDESIIEHHSNLDPEKETNKNRIQSENWDAPVIVTTNVQLFESLHSNKSSRTRRLHNIAQSVIILDEAQMLPTVLLEPILKSLTTLKEDYGCTIVFCTATQPVLNKSSYMPNGIENVREVVPNQEELSIGLQRVEPHFIDHMLSIDELAERIISHRQALCIVNTKKDAYKIFSLIKETDTEGVFHLSTQMCPVHRRDKLAKIKERLANGYSCRVVSTQLIEAGVDIDFPVVYRATTGLDSIAQAAGRCNREALLEKGTLYVFNMENGLHPGQLKRAAESGEQIIFAHKDDFLSLEANKEYFIDFYQKESRISLKNGNGFDRKGVLHWVGNNEGEFYFRGMASAFKFIENDTTGVIISWNRDWLEELREYEYIGFFPKNIRRELQQYTVNLYTNQFQVLKEEAQIVDFFNDGQYLFLANDEISKKRYDKEVGIHLDQQFKDIDSLIL